MTEEARQGSQASRMHAVGFETLGSCLSLPQFPAGVKWDGGVSSECDGGLEFLHIKGLGKCLGHKRSVAVTGPVLFILIAVFTVHPLPSLATSLGLMSHIYLPRPYHTTLLRRWEKLVPSIHRRGGRASSLPSLRTEADSQLPDSRPLCLSPAMLCTEVSLGSDGAGPSYMACGHPEQHGGGRISYLGRRGERLGSYRTTEGRPGKRKGCFSLEQHDTGGRGFYASLPERWVQASVCK